MSEGGEGAETHAEASPVPSDPVPAPSAKVPPRNVPRSRLRVGAFVWINAVFTPIFWLACSSLFVIEHFTLNERSGLGIAPAWAGPVFFFLVGIHAAIALVSVVSTTFAVRSLGVVQPGTRGRARLTLQAIGGAAANVLTLAMVLIAHYGMPASFGEEVLFLDDPQGFTVFQDVWSSLSLPFMIGYRLTLVLSVASHLFVLGSTVGIWFLFPLAFRRWFWIVVDGLATVGFIAATVTLPIEPHGDDPIEKGLASIRLAVTVFLGMRVALRVLGPTLDLVERFGFRPMVAARHLRAKKSQFLTAIGLLSILAVSFSSCSLVTTLSVMGGFRDDLERKILGNNAHVVVDVEMGTMSNWRPSLALASRQRGVIGAAPYVAGEVMLTSASNLGGAVLRGIDPNAIDHVLDLRRNMRQGRIEYLENPERLLDLPPEETRGFAVPMRTHFGDEGEEPGDDAEPKPPRDPIDIEIDRLLNDPPRRTGGQVLPGIIIGQELAHSLRLYVGDEVNVVTPHGELGPSGPMPKSRPFRVAGIFYSGMYEYDMKYCYVMLDTAQRFLNMGDDISGIEIKVDDSDRAPAIADSIRTALAGRGARVQDWQELNKNLFGALKLEKLAMFIALGISIMVAGFCVFGTLTLMVQEKSREVGILKSMGTPGQAIINIFMLEGLLIGVFGSTTGLALGYVACFTMENFGIRMSPEVYYIDQLPVHTDALEFVAVAFASAVVSLLATIFPAVLASKLQPVDALRYE